MRISDCISVQPAIPAQVINLLWIIDPARSDDRDRNTWAVVVVVGDVVNGKRESTYGVGDSFSDNYVLPVIIVIIQLSSYILYEVVGYLIYK